MNATIAALESGKYVSLETFKRDGGGVRTPVWFAVVGDKLYVFTDGTSFKVKRIGRDSRARVALCNVSGEKILGPWYDGRAEILDPGLEEDAAYAALRKKYGLLMRLLDLGSKIGGRYNRRKMIAVSFP